VLLLHRKRSVPAITNYVDEQCIWNFSLDRGDVHDVVAVMNDPAPDACPARELPHRDSQEIATALAFFKDPGADVFCLEASPPEGLAQQPELQQLLAISSDCGMPAYREQRGVHIRSMVIQRQSAGGKQAIVKQRRT
jgi:hypothetical protein